VAAFIERACIFLFAYNVSPERCLQAGLQIMWAHLQLIWVEGIGYLQIIQAEKTDVFSSYGLCLQAATGIALV
jgi:hypothetical protein